jgi:hypothetical protein
MMWPAYFIFLLPNKTIPKFLRDSGTERADPDF